jgi:cell wall-associated NlpC family hydrolase
MKRFYNTEERINILREEAESWVGTPYKHRTGVKGRGVDCIFFVIACLEASGGLQGRIIKAPNYAKDWGLHRGEELLKKELKRQFPVYELNGDFDSQIYSGDIVLYKFGRQSCHAGLYIDGIVYQCLARCGVRDTSYGSPDFKKRVTDVYVIYEE